MNLDRVSDDVSALPWRLRRTTGLWLSCSGFVMWLRDIRSSTMSNAAALLAMFLVPLVVLCIS